MNNSPAQRTPSTRRRRPGQFLAISRARVSRLCGLLTNRCLDIENPRRVETDTSGVHLWLVLMKAHAALERIATESIANTGVCLTDFKIMEILLHRGALPVNTLAGRVGLTSGSATAAIDRLAARGLVERKASFEDRRERVVHPTQAGLTLASGAFGKHAADMEAAAEVLSEDDRLQLIDLLRRFGRKAGKLAGNS